MLDNSVRLLRTNGVALKKTCCGRVLGPLRAIYLLNRRTDEESGLVQIELVRPPEALSPLLSHSFHLHLRDRNRNRDMIANYATLLARVPIYRLSYPTGLQHVAAILDQLSQHMEGQEAGRPHGTDHRE